VKQILSNVSKTVYIILSVKSYLPTHAVIWQQCQRAVIFHELPQTPETHLSASFSFILSSSNTLFRSGTNVCYNDTRDRALVYSPDTCASTVLE